MSIWAHTLVFNEERFLWYAVTSVISHVDKVLLWDTGSFDLTPEIIEKIKKRWPEKVIFRQLGRVALKGVSQARQRMLEETDADWFITLDGDEVWWEGSIRKVVETIDGEGVKLDSVFNPTIFLIGDMYHREEEAAGQYKIDEKSGFISLRAINRKIPGLHVRGIYPLEGYYDQNGVLVQERPRGRRKFIERGFMHMSHLRRSVERREKIKYELGEPIPSDFFYPEVFFRPKPSLIPDVWTKINALFFLRGALETPPKKIKRRLLKTKKPSY